MFRTWSAPPGSRRGCKNQKEEKGTLPVEGRVLRQGGRDSLRGGGLHAPRKKGTGWGKKTSLKKGGRGTGDLEKK